MVAGATALATAHKFLEWKNNILVILTDFTDESSSNANLKKSFVLYKIEEQCDSKAYLTLDDMLLALFNNILQPSWQLPILDFQKLPNRPDIYIICDMIRHLL